MRFTLSVFMFLLATQLFAQKVDIAPTIEPQFFAADEEITISYDVTGTSLQTLSEAWLWLWVPNSSINTPSNVNPANSNSAGSEPAKLTKTLIDGKHILSIKLTLTQFTDGTKDQITSVGLLIKGNDWADGQSEDFVTEINDDFKVIFENPVNNFDFYSASQDLIISLKSSEDASIKLYLDDNLIAEANNVTSLIHTHTILTDGLVHDIKATASTSLESDSIFYSYSIKPTTVLATLPSGIRDGINYHADSTSATLVLLAPNKENVFVIGSFNNWSLDNRYLMFQDGERFWLKLKNLERGKEYLFQYLIDGNLRIADAYSEKIASPYDDSEIISDNRYPGLLPYPTGKTEHAVSYLQTAQEKYDWKIKDFQKPVKEDLVVYEILIRDFDVKRTYNAVIDRLDYLETLGINAIELMPIMEFEGNLSWGYNPAFMFATDKYYGTENELKKLIDEAHKRGMAVIFDIVLNHAFGRSPLARLDNDGDYGAPTNANVWLNRTAKHDYNVGYDFNHESQYTKNYVDRVTEYWIQEYKIDGYRFDLTKGFTQKNTAGNTNAFGQYDASRIALLKRMADHVWTIDPTSYVILEHFAENSEETELANYGMMLWSNMNGSFIATGKGSVVNIDWLYHGTRGWNSPHAIGYMESHDEERFVWELIKSGSISLKESLTRAKINAAFFFLVPGPKMIWQFGEFGYDEELNNDRLGIKETKWEYLDNEDRKELHDVYTSLVNLKTKTNLVKSENFSWKGSGSFKWINLNNSDVKISVIGNLGTINKIENAHFISDGTWYDYFSGQTIEITDFQNHEASLRPGEFHIYTSKPIDNYLTSNPTILSLGSSEVVQINIHPNPTNESITLLSQGNISRLKLYDFSGREMEIRTQGEMGIYIINLSHLKAGLFLIEGYTNGMKFSKRIIKQN